MTRKRLYDDLYVYMNSVKVGILTREPSGHLKFTYNADWLTWEHTRPISLSMPLTEIPYKGPVVENFFDNLLPDNVTIRERIQIRFNIPSRKSFDLLSYIGSDCVGALQLLTKSKVSTVKKIQAKAINNHEIAKLLKHYRNAPLGMDRESEFRISIAGAQEKTALLWYHNKWCLPEGTTPTSHIIKLPIGKIKHSNMDLSESIENEWLCLKILSAYNLPVNHADIMQFDDVNTLVVERFDRSWTDNNRWLMRLPQEDFCQVLGKPSSLKYESEEKGQGPGIKDIMDILLGSNDAINDRKKFMKSVFLFWVLGAIDGHAKNFSIFIGPQGRYQLTPLYDVISAYPLAEKRQLEWKELKMAMSLKGKNRHYHWYDIQLRHWIDTASYCQFSPADMQIIIDEALDTMDSIIDRVAQAIPKKFPLQMSDAIFAGMRKVKNRCKSN